MQLHQLLIILSALLTTGAVIPYLLDVLKRKTKPRIVSWAIWTVLMAIVASASYKNDATLSAILAFAAMTGNILIVIFGYKNSNNKYERIDIFSLIFAGIGLTLWWLFNSPLIATVMVLSVDFIAGLPTIWHGYKKPREETLSFFALSGLGAFCSLIALNNYTVNTLVVPLYLTLINVFFVGLLVIRRKQIKK